MIEPAAQKSADAYRTISEVAADLKLPQHVLRFWETRFPQVKPLKRAGGRRFYRPEDVDLLRAVKALLYGDGYTIKGVQRILREQGPRAVAALAGAQARGGRPASDRGAARRPDRVAEAVEDAPATPPSLRAAATAAEGAPAGSGAAVPAPVVAKIGMPDDTPRDAAARLRDALAELDACVAELANIGVAPR